RGFRYRSRRPTHRSEWRLDPAYTRAMSMTAALRDRVEIDLGDRSYPILIGTGLLDDPDAFSVVPAATSALIVTNTTVAPLYSASLQAELAKRFRTVHTLELPDGEVYKDWDTLNRIFDALLGHGADRKTVLFALGGGVVGDMTGFAAASYM